MKIARDRINDINKVLNTIINGDTLEVLKTFPDESVDCVVTSPPYYCLRDYGIDGQLGLEKNFNNYLDNLIEIFAEVKRVSKPTGTIWVNLGDSYGTVSGRSQQMAKGKTVQETQYSSTVQSKIGWIPPTQDNKPKDMHKSLMNIPSRFAIRMTDELGFILRNEIIWHKNNCLPQSVKDRFTVDFEKIYFFVKNKKYYFEQITEPSQDTESYTGIRKRNKGKYEKDGYTLAPHHFSELTGKTYPERNKRCVWDINTKGFNGAKLLADYVGSDGKPYIASPDCPYHSHLAYQKSKQTGLYDGQLNQNENHNDYKYENHVQVSLGGVSSNSLNSNDKIFLENSVLQNPENKDESKKNLQTDFESGQESVSQTSSHTKHTHKSYEQGDCKNDVSFQQDFQTAILHNKENHKSTYQKEQNDISCEEKTCHKPDKQQETFLYSQDENISENNISEDSSSNEKGINLSEQKRFHSVNICNSSYNKDKQAKCNCQVVNIDHFATFPPDLIKLPIKAGCPENGIVLDIFMGAGTTGMVALQQNKNFIGIELNPEYIRLANKRLEPYLTEQKLFTNHKII